MKNLLVVLGLALSLSSVVQADTITQNSGRDTFSVSINGNGSGAASEIYDVMEKSKLFERHNGFAGYSYNSADVSVTSLSGEAFIATLSSPSPFKVVDQVIKLEGGLAREFIDILKAAGMETTGRIRPQGSHTYSNGKSIKCAEGFTVFGGAGCTITVN